MDIWEKAMEGIHMKSKIKELAYQLKADVCGIGSIDRFKDAPTGFMSPQVRDSTLTINGQWSPKGVV